MNQWLHIGRRALLAAVLCVCLVTCALAENVSDESAAPQIDGAQATCMAELVDALCQVYGLNASNFSLSYYNTVTGACYYYNADAWMVAASTYKLPLNMYYYELEAAGDIAPDATFGGHSLEEIHYESLVNSNNELSEDLIAGLGTFRHYKELMFQNYGELDPSTLPDIVWTKNYYTTRYMLNTLHYLYDNRDSFPQLLDYLEQAQSEAYFKKYVSDYSIAQKYGSFDGAENAVGIVYTTQPYLLAVYTYNVPGVDGEDLVGRINAAVCAYQVASETPSQVQQTTPAAQIPGNAAQDTAQAAADVISAPVTPSPQGMQGILAYLPAEAQTFLVDYWMALVAGFVALCALVGLWVVLARRHRENMATKP